MKNFTFFLLTTSSKTHEYFTLTAHLNLHTLAIFQVFNSHMWLMATILTSADLAPTLWLKASSILCLKHLPLKTSPVEMLPSKDPAS